MKFVITKASVFVSYSSPQSYPLPCEGAVLENVGSRYGPLPVMEVSDLDALMELAEEQGSPLIITPADMNDSTYGDRLPHIKIYDDYVE